MKTVKFSKFLLIMAVGLFSIACAAKGPKGNLIYCSYAKSGSAGLGKEYCELIADKDSIPKVFVALRIGNRFGDPEIRREYPVDAAVVGELQSILAQMEVYKLNGYNLDEAITGGYAYRLYMEYDSGETVNIRWYGHGVKDKVQEAYHRIHSFFEPWRSRAEKAEDTIIGCEYVAEKVAGRGTDACMLFCETGYMPTVNINLNVDNRFRKPEIHKQEDITPEQVDELRKALTDLAVQEMGDYEKDDCLEGGTIYSVTIKYQSGRIQRLRWHSHDVDPAAEAVYDCVESFFAPWRKR